MQLESGRTRCYKNEGNEEEHRLLWSADWRYFVLCDGMGEDEGGQDRDLKTRSTSRHVVLISTDDGFIWTPVGLSLLLQIVMLECEGQA
jgi:hypothetical protein